jgi:adenylate kinase
MHTQKPLIIAFLGKSGSGKGTQVELLKDKLGLEYIGSGNLLRARKQEQDFTGNKIASIIDDGGIVPSPIIFELWMRELEKIKDNGPIKGILIDGSPRKYLEALLLEEAIAWYDWADNFKVLYLDVSDEEIMDRLSKRGRIDDTEEGIRKRMEWFNDDVRPVIDFYKNNNRLIEINGEQSVEEVYAEILNKLEL